MTIPEQAGKVATSAVEALRNSPGLLVLVLLQLITLVVLAYVQEANNARRQERELALLQGCFSPKSEDRR